MRTAVHDGHIGHRSQPLSSGPNRSLDRPLGEGGLERWARDVATYREQHGNMGATVIGRRMFSGGDGRWDDDPNADGWWGNRPPFHHPCSSSPTMPASQ
jgi:hypothetical protein